MKKKRTFTQEEIDEYRKRDLGPNLSEFELKHQAKINELFATLEGDELVNAVIDCSHRENYKSPPPEESRHEFLTVIRQFISIDLSKVISEFISDTHRETIVRYHARGLTTTEAVQALIDEDSTMNRLAQRDAIGEKELQKLLIPRLAYLKPGTARWPEQKYGNLWREARQEYAREINNPLFASPQEQIGLLSKNLERINTALDKSRNSASDARTWTQALNSTLAALQKLTPTEQLAPENAATPQLIPMLQRLTVAIETLQNQMATSNPNLLIELLEQLTLATQPPTEQKAITNETHKDTQKLK